MNLKFRSLSLILGCLFAHEGFLEASAARSASFERPASQNNIDSRALATETERAAKRKQEEEQQAIARNQIHVEGQQADEEGVEIEGQPGLNPHEAAAPGAQAVAQIPLAPAAGGEIHNHPEGPVPVVRIDLHVPHNISIIGKDWVDGNDDEMFAAQSFNKLRAAQHAQNRAHMIVRVVTGEGTAHAPYYPYYYDADSFHRIMSNRDRLQKHAANNLQAAIDEANGEPVADHAQRDGPAEPHDRNFKLWHKKERITYFICYPRTNHYEYAGSFSDLHYQLLHNTGSLLKALTDNGYNIPLAREAVVNSEKSENDDVNQIRNNDNVAQIRNLVGLIFEAPNPDENRPARCWYHYIGSFVGMGALGVLHGFSNNIWARNKGENLKNWHWNRAPKREWLTGLIFKSRCDNLLTNIERNPFAVSKGEYFFEALLYTLYGAGQFYAERLALPRFGYHEQRDGAMNFAFVQALLSLLRCI